eukprot:191614-Chlamydomonas_euryale.AAC.12
MECSDRSVYAVTSGVTAKNVASVRNSAGTPRGVACWLAGKGLSRSWSSACDPVSSKATGSAPPDEGCGVDMQ